MNNLDVKSVLEGLHNLQDQLEALWRVSFCIVGEPGIETVPGNNLPPLMTVQKGW